MKERQRPTMRQYAHCVNRVSGQKKSGELPSDSSTTIAIIAESRPITLVGYNNARIAYNLKAKEKPPT